MTTVPWRAHCWGGPLDGNRVWIPCCDDGMPLTPARIEQISIDWDDDSQALPIEQVLRAANSTGRYVLDRAAGVHPAVGLRYRWHDRRTSMQASTTSDEGDAT